MQHLPPPVIVKILLRAELLNPNQYPPNIIIIIIIKFRKIY